MKLKDFYSSYSDNLWIAIIDMDTAQENEEAYYGNMILNVIISNNHVGIHERYREKIIFQVKDQKPLGPRAVRNRRLKTIKQLFSGDVSFMD
jgi:hypothetical protein